MQHHITIPGISFRSWRSAADYGAMRAVCEGCLTYDQLDPLSPEEALPTEANLAATFSPADHRNLECTLLLVEGADSVIGYHTIHWWQHSAGMSYFHRGYLLPAWRGKGIGTAMVHWAEASIRTIAATHHVAEIKQFRACVAHTEREANAVLVNEGYEPSADMIEMGRDVQALPKLLLPEGFLLQPATPEHYGTIWEANEEVFRDEPERSPASEASYQAFLSEPGFDPSLWQVIWHGHQVAGVALCEITSAGVGCITQLGVREPWRRQSVGSALIAHALHGLCARGVHQIRVVTDAANVGARRLYERTGFRILKGYTHYRKAL